MSNIEIKWFPYIVSLFIYFNFFFPIELSSNTSFSIFLTLPKIIQLFFFQIATSSNCYIYNNIQINLLLVKVYVWSVVSVRIHSVTIYLTFLATTALLASIKHFLNKTHARIVWQVNTKINVHNKIAFLVWLVYIPIKIYKLFVNGAEKQVIQVLPTTNLRCRTKM